MGAMTNEQILEKQVEALEKLLQLRSAIIEDLESKVGSLQNEIAKQNYQPYPYIPGNIINVPYVGQPTYQGIPMPIGGAGQTIVSCNTCPDGTPHNYPSQWGPNSTVGTSLTCTKCGASQHAVPAWTTIAQNGSVTIAGGTGVHQTLQTTDHTVGNVFTLANGGK
jgi:hypothetical protein